MFGFHTFRRHRSPAQEMLGNLNRLVDPGRGFSTLDRGNIGGLTLAESRDPGAPFMFWSSRGRVLFGSQEPVCRVCPLPSQKILDQQNEWF
jgi:hypothetical protein